MKEVPYVEVGILKSTEISFQLAGKYTLNGNQGQNHYGSFKAYADPEGISLRCGDEIFPCSKEIVFLPCNLSADYFEINDVIIGIDFHWEQKENQQFRGALKLIPNGDEILVINILPVENYLYSVISSEMRGDSSLELLKAHAIISRSWLLAQIDPVNRYGNNGEFKSEINTDNKHIKWYAREDHHHFHVCADDHCQRYQGITRAYNPNVIKAVQETAGTILTYENKISDARYSKCCGGIMERFENCWEPVEHPYLDNIFDGPAEENNTEPNVSDHKKAEEFINSTPVAWCNTTDPKVLSQVLNDYDLETPDFFRWEVTYGQETLATLLHKKSGIDFGQIKRLTPLKRGPSGRITELQIEGIKKTKIVGKELEIRKWLSESHLYSSAFIVLSSELDGDIPGKFQLKGAGWGHGVGLCQIGAAVMGAKGYSFKKILGHYYPGTDLKKWY